jgi:hypothetical protein
VHQQIEAHLQVRNIVEQKDEIVLAPCQRDREGAERSDRASGEAAASCSMKDLYGSTIGCSARWSSKRRKPMMTATTTKTPRAINSR